MLRAQESSIAAEMEGARWDLGSGNEHIGKCYQAGTGDASLISGGCVDNISKNAYSQVVKSSEFKRWLAAKGATFSPGKGSHLKVELNGKISYPPMHSKDLGPGLVITIKKQLGLK
jgi:mRNA interferase HicA